MEIIFVINIFAPRNDNIVTLQLSKPGKEVLSFTCIFKYRKIFKYRSVLVFQDLTFTNVTLNLCKKPK